MNDKMYKGKKPRTEGWEQISEVEQDVRWLVFVRQKDDTDWLTVKIVAAGRARGKANYWIGWNGKRFSQQTDTFLLMQQRPELMHKVEQMLEGYALI